MEEQDTGHADHKCTVLCFVAAEEHPGKGTDTAADECQQEQSPLRDTPFFANCPFFICAVNKECNQIDCQKPVRHIVHCALESVQEHSNSSLLRCLFANSIVSYPAGISEGGGRLPDQFP